MQKILRHIPWPIRIFLLIGLVLMFSKLVKGLSSMTLSGTMLIVALFLWVVVIIGLLFAMGLFPAVARYSWLHGILNRLTNGLALGKIPGRESKTDDTAKRKQYLEEAETVLASLKDIDAVDRTVRTELIDLIARARQQGQAGFGVRAPGVALLFFGPKGVGKTSYVELLAARLYGLGALPRATLVRFSRSELASGQSVTQIARDKARRALDGMLLFDDADWILERDNWGASPGIDIGTALQETTKDYPHRLLVAFVFSDAGAISRIVNDEAHQGWMNSFYVVESPFEGLSDAALFDLLSTYLREDNLQMPALPESTEKSMKSCIRNRKRLLKEQFANAHDMRRLCDKIKSKVGPYGIVLPDHVREAEQEL